MESSYDFFFVTNTIGIVFMVKMMISQTKEIIRLKKFGSDNRDYKKAIKTFTKVMIFFGLLTIWNLYSNIGYLSDMINELEMIFYQNIIHIID
jgi:hypothetical protein